MSPAFSQFVYEIDQSIEVIDGDTLSMPWAGGLNAPQFSTMDLDQTGEADLVVFDRATSKLSTFIAVDGRYVYAPEYEPYFPSDLRNWVLLRDYNCDGKKDLFVSDPRGVAVYENTTVAGGELSWRIFNFRSEQNFKHILTQGFTSVINLQINGSDIPAISDVDGDGDLDILAFRFSGASTVEFHKNLSMERDGNCDSLQFERVTQTWGEFEECECGGFAFNGDDCPPENGGRVNHQGGKSILLQDLDGDAVKDILFSEEQCSELYALRNSGSQDNALISSVDSNFPNATNPARLFVFPAAYSEDVDFDGKADLLVAPNVPANVGGGVNFESSSWFYKNTGDNNNPNYTLLQRNFLQDEMIDVGENAAPAFFDADADGDLDMFLGSYIRGEDLGFRSSLSLYENIGNVAEPVFSKSTDDYLFISALGFINIKPKFRDINSDGRIDLVFSATELNAGTTNIYYYLNQSDNGLSINASEVQLLFTIGNSFPNNENFEVNDIDGDGLKDLLIGRSTGKLEYHRNIGTNASPDYALIDDSFYGFSFSAFRQSPAASVGDLDGDGKEDMLIGDAGGNLTIYPDFKSNIENPARGTTKLFRDNNLDSLAIRLGNRLLPTIANLFSVDKPSIVLGTGGGGLKLLIHSDAVANPVIQFKKDIGVFPNPVIKGDLLTVGSTKNTIISIVTITGQTVYNNIELRAGETVQLTTANLKAGVYTALGIINDEYVSVRFVVVD